MALVCKSPGPDWCLRPGTFPAGLARKPASPSERAQDCTAPCWQRGTGDCGLARPARKKKESPCGCVPGCSSVQGRARGGRSRSGEQEGPRLFSYLETEFLLEGWSPSGEGPIASTIQEGKSPRHRQTRTHTHGHRQTHIHTDTRTPEATATTKPASTQPFTSANCSPESSWLLGRDPPLLSEFGLHASQVPDTGVLGEDRAVESGHGSRN